MNARIKAISVSRQKGQKKNNVSSALLKQNFGVIGDAHAGSEREVSLLAEESIEKMRQRGLDVNAGDFAENITTEGIDLLDLEIGTKIKIGKGVVLEVTHIGKVCHSRCNIYYQAGDCIMPKEGIFAKIIKGGEIKPGDRICIL
jgi:cyclic pyranopterin phosphate synthase